MIINGDACNDRLLKLNKPMLSFDEGKDLYEQKEKIRQAYRSLLGLDKIEGNCAPSLSVEVEYVEERDGYVEIRFTFESEIDSVVPGYLLMPRGKTNCPLVITLQGHSTGAHNSIGKPLYNGDEEYIKTRGDFGVQAAKRGYAALVIEQRAMGERHPQRKERGGAMCSFAATRALMLGKTIIGERVFDISRGIDAVQELEEWSKKIDFSKIVCTGNSGGGTATYYAACYDERITYAVPSCGVCTYRSSIADVFHCACNYIPHVLEYFEMGDLSILIAPRKLTLVNGSLDEIFPINGSRDIFAEIERIYKAAGAEENARLVLTDKGHWWCKDIIWNEISAMLS